jgi:hypothetical protein
MSSNFTVKDGNGNPLTKAAIDITGAGVYADQVVPGDGTNNFGSGRAANLTGKSAAQAQMTTPAGQWPATSTSSGTTPASASQAAAGAGIRNVFNGCSVKLSGDGTGAAFQGTLNLRDGATGAGTVLMSWVLSIPAGADAIGQGIDISGLAIPGSANTAMTLEFTTAVAHVIESVNMFGTTTQ